MIQRANCRKICKAQFSITRWQYSLLVMVSPRFIVYFVLIYSGILAVSLVTLSIMSLTAYGCGFDFRQSSVTYMLYIIYYRAARCHSSIDWSLLDGIRDNPTAQPDMPSETHAVFRTFIFSLFNLVLGILMTMTSILALSGSGRLGKSRCLVFTLYFSPFIAVFISVIALDLISSGFYLFEYFKTLGVNGLMSLLEIRNQGEMRPIFDQIAVGTRSFPSLIMFAATSKCLLFLILNIILVFVFTPAAWRVCRENEDFIEEEENIVVEDSTSTRIPRVPLDRSSNSPNNVRVAGRVNSMQTRQQSSGTRESLSSSIAGASDNTYEAQPAFNPYVKTKYESHF